MNLPIVLKAIAEETRLKILKMLLQHNYCGRALSRNLDLSEAAVSQHLKVLREAGLLTGEKKGYFMHYYVNREVLHNLSSAIEELAFIERQECNPESGGCRSVEQGRCHVYANENNQNESSKNEGSGVYRGDSKCNKS